VHGNTVELLVERGQESDDFQVGSLAKDVERPGAILAGTPGEQDFEVGHWLKKHVGWSGSPLGGAFDSG
jgi:hypothetical protein